MNRRPCCSSKSEPLYVPRLPQHPSFAVLLALSSESKNFGFAVQACRRLETCVPNESERLDGLQVLEYAAPGSALLEEELAEGAEPADPAQQEADEAAASAGATSDALLPAAQVMAALVGDGDVAAEGDAAGAVIAATVVGEVTICYADRLLITYLKISTSKISSTKSFFDW